MMRLPFFGRFLAVGLPLLALLGWMTLPVQAKKTTALPDLTIDEDRIATSALTEFKIFTGDEDDCAVVEGCVNEPGERLLLRFDLATPNIGTADMVLGKPKEATGLFEFSPCHGHYHFSGYALYELFDEFGNPVVDGRKQAFCLEDSEPIDPNDPKAGKAKYWCGHQGISAGWLDVYTRDLDCQWLDITDVPAGLYELRVTVNPDRDLTEANYDNNEASIFLTLDDEGVIDVLP